MSGLRDPGRIVDDDGQARSGDLPARVLVADDEHLVATVLAEYLRHLGVEVVGPARNGFDAVRLAEERGADMALVDIRMPQMDGLEVARVLHHRLNIPVIIVSAFSDPDCLQKGTQAGVFGYLLKPVSADELRATIAVAWSRYRHQTQLRGEVEDLKAALEQRKLVERAKGVLMDRLKLSEGDAMKRLQKQARDNRRKLHEVAKSILETEQLLTGGADRAGGA